MTHIKAVVFDMDGVLVDAREWHYIALNRALELFGYSISAEDHREIFDGLPTKKKLEMLSINNDLPVGLHGFINQLKQKYTIELIYKYCRPTFKHEYALQQLKTQGFKIGLASNSVMATIQLMMEHTALKKYLDFIISAEDVVNGKPDPEIYTKLFLKLGVDPCAVVVVEDNENGVVAATKSGAHVLRVESPREVNIEAVLSFIEELG
jgi:beta-phosphoglucomutase